MSESSSEPTMEEILASIRRIISEDEQPAEAATPIEADPEPESAPAPPPLPIPMDDEPEPTPSLAIPIPEDEPEDDALELTQKVETHGDLDVLAPTDLEMPEEIPPPPPPVAGHEPFWPNQGKLVSDPTEEAAVAAFGRLSSSILMPAHGRTLEDVVRELLSPLLKQWLDDNLPRIVQNAVDEEVQRIARGGRPPGT
jgi:cell pole-organizing protein PopZ